MGAGSTNPKNYLPKLGQAFLLNDQRLIDYDMARYPQLGGI